MSESGWCTRRVYRFAVRRIEEPLTGRASHKQLVSPEGRSVTHSRLEHFPSAAATHRTSVAHLRAPVGTFHSHRAVVTHVLAWSRHGVMFGVARTLPKQFAKLVTTYGNIYISQIVLRPRRPRVQLRRQL